MKPFRGRPPWQLIARDGWRFLLPALLVALAAWALGWAWVGWAALGAACFVGFFFRDPERAIPQASCFVVSPADGRVVAIERRGGGEETEDGGAQTISIFLSLFNVHVNRAPLEARVEGLSYSPGRFLPAFRGEASSENEQNAIRLHAREGPVEVKQIAGLLARRIVCWVSPGDALSRGQRIGLIRFGSRVDVKLPASATLLVREGSRVRGGTTILARLAT